MDEKEQFVRYAYIKNGDVVTQLQRILPITDTIPTSGPDAFISDFLRFVGRQSVLLISCHERNFEFHCNNIAARVFLLNMRSCGAFGKIIGSIFAFFKTLFLLVKFRPDRILCGRAGGMLWATLLVSRLCSIPFVYSAHQNLSNPRHPWYRRLIAAIDRWCILCAKAVVCHGPYMNKQLSEMGVPSNRIFEFDVDLRDMLTELTANKKISDLINFDGDMIVLYVGRIVGSKGVFDLLDACSERLLIDPRVKLVYVGNGSQLELLQTRVAALGLTDRAIFTGAVEHDMLAHIISKARIVVTPTRSANPKKGLKEAAEARCMAAMESLSMGVPVVAPNSGPFPFLIKQGINGLLYETDSVEALKRAILSVLDNDELYTRLRGGAMESGRNLLGPAITFSQAVKRAFT
jgi:glycosyltransferase involved in cell wall biosynthesis